MPSIRNLLFIIVSISALVYLVLQSSHGQRWLLQSQQPKLIEPALQEQRDNLHKLKAETLSDSLNKTAKSNEQDEQIKQLKNQISIMHKDISELNQKIQEIVISKNALPEHIQERVGESTPFVSNPKEQHIQEDKTAEDLQFLAPVGKTVTIEAPNKLEARQRQLEQQARLREVVQQMELTALQAISR
ncbi:hypothetical protein [Brumicola nitratireducens]|uniref:Uncharacterized protein n=1 Tax=Glaciecola nitratireducens (strain JCM 12485 / KCTC 12276 / FR1064) TaxID=1085623 RepID=G4QGK3_GLANF|nr:hypothetical protein [Glaciecola nitratireducens]AEP29640.1 hypothetical protein GNIT_1522 [Glaciecola nitratireducens FR1064]